MSSWTEGEVVWFYSRNEWVLRKVERVWSTSLWVNTGGCTHEELPLNTDRLKRQSPGFDPRPHERPPKVAVQMPKPPDGRITIEEAMDPNHHFKRGDKLIWMCPSSDDHPLTNDYSATCIEDPNHGQIKIHVDGATIPKYVSLGEVRRKCFKNEGRSVTG